MRYRSLIHRCLFPPVEYPADRARPDTFKMDFLNNMTAMVLDVSQNCMIFSCIMAGSWFRNTIS